jgi:hypothetical protein
MVRHCVVKLRNSRVFSQRDTKTPAAKMTSETNDNANWFVTKTLNKHRKMFTFASRAEAVAFVQTTIQTDLGVTHAQPVLGLHTEGNDGDPNSVYDINLFSAEQMVAQDVVETARTTAAATAAAEATAAAAEAIAAAEEAVKATAAAAAAASAAAEASRNLF